MFKVTSKSDMVLIYDALIGETKALKKLLKETPNSPSLQSKINIAREMLLDLELSLGEEWTAEFSRLKELVSGESTTT